jgi:hypothetical protein
MQFPFRQIADECEEFVELTGDVGDVSLLVPFSGLYLPGFHQDPFSLSCSVRRRW